ncbi:MAG: vWA domain-containing protein [Acidobacteriota bacterium]
MPYRHQTWRGERRLGNLASLLASTLLFVTFAASTQAGMGGPDDFGYFWNDSDEMVCSATDARDGTGLANSAEFFDGVVFQNRIGPFDIGFAFPWYERLATQVWINRNGLIFFELPPDSSFNTARAIPTAMDGPMGFLAPYWDFLGTPTNGAVTWESFPADGYFHLRMSATTVFTGQPVVFEVYLFEGGDVRIFYSDPPNAPRNGTIGTENYAENTGLAIQNMGVPSGGMMMPDGGPFAICIDRESQLDCAAAPPITCGTTMGTSPAMVPTNITGYGCSAGINYDGNEAIYALDVPFLGDVDITLSGIGGRDMAVFLLDGCDEWLCLGGGGTTAMGTTLTPGTYYVVVDALTPGDEGDFQLDIACTELSTAVTCESTTMGTTIGAPNRLAGYACLPGDFSGPDVWYSINVPPASNLNVTVTSASLTLGAVILRSGDAFEASSCVLGGSPNVTLFGADPGTYLIGVDGPMGAGEDFTLRVTCQPEIDCAAATDVMCNESVMGDTSLSGTDLVASYPCIAGNFSGNEQIYRFDNPASQPISLVLDDSADTNLDLFLLDACNEGDCIGFGDNEISRLLDPGEYYIVVDGQDEAAAPFELFVICANSIDPAVIFIDGGPETCVEEHKTVFLTPAIPRADVMFMIDLTGSMIGPRTELINNMTNLVTRLEEVVNDVHFGLISYKDYDTTGNGLMPCPYNATNFGGAGDYPYRLEQPITGDRILMENAVMNIPPASGGFDGPEAYSRAMFELYSDPGIGWRDGSRKIAVNFGDNVPHDCNILECLGATSTLFEPGIDVGRDGMPDSGDELAILDVIQGLIDNDITLIHMNSGSASDSGFTYLDIWDCWAEQTGGDALQLNFDGTVPDGIDLVDYVGNIIDQQGSFCSTLRLEAEPGFEDWVVDAGVTINDRDLPTSAEFDIRVCIPPGTPEGDYSFEIQVLCSGGVVIAQTIESSISECAPDGVVPPPDREICLGESTMLDASGMTLEDCMGGVAEYEWFDGMGMSIGTGPTIDVTPAFPTIYSVAVTCSTDPTCNYTRRVQVDVDAPPMFDVARAVDASSCNIGIDLSWDAAIFAGVDGTYNIYRSTVDCADALAQPPLIMGIAADELGWIDLTTTDGMTYHYVIEAEGPAGTPCMPVGAAGGAATRICLPAVLEDGSATAPRPDGVYATLLMRHDGEEVTAYWDGARALGVGEEYYLLKALDRPTEAFRRVNPMGDTTREFVDLDTSSPRQFFDLRVQNACGDISLDEYPPTGP